jgi:hypothetical protein
MAALLSVAAVSVAILAITYRVFVRASTSFIEEIGN